MSRRVGKGGRGVCDFGTMQIPPLPTLSHTSGWYSVGKGGSPAEPN
jgi:hypothetical protein